MKSSLNFWENRNFQEKEVFDTAKKYAKFRDEYKTAELEHQFVKNEEELKEIRDIIQKNHTSLNPEQIFSNLKQKIIERQGIVGEFAPILKLQSFFFSPELVDKNGLNKLFQK